MKAHCKAITAIAEQHETPHQLARQIGEELLRQLAPSLGVGRASFTVAEIASRNGVSTRHVYCEIAARRLNATRPGNGTLVRITPRDESLWLHGQVCPNDKPVGGVSSTSSQRARTRAVIARARARMGSES